jgi:hypothetical protein
VGGLPYDLTEGDIITVFSQWVSLLDVAQYSLVFFFFFVFFLFLFLFFIFFSPCLFCGTQRPFNSIVKCFVLNVHAFKRIRLVPIWFQVRWDCEHKPRQGQEDGEDERIRFHLLRRPAKYCFGRGQLQCNEGEILLVYRLHFP